MSAAAPVVDARQFLRGHAPFSQLREDDLDFLAQHVEAVRFARGDVVLAPGHGAPQACFIVGQGAVEAVRQFGGRRETSADQPVFLVPGDVCPVGALMAQRPASSVYRAAGELDCWRLPKAHFDELLRRSEVFLDFCKRRMAALLELSNQALQASYAAEAAQWRTINAPLESMLRRAPVTCAPDTPIRRVFEEMEKERVGAMLVIETAADGAQSVAGILTRQDVIGRVVLPGVPLDAPIGNVMSAPVLTLDAGESVGAAMLLMAERSIRHVPVTREGRVAGVVTERDLFVLQRRSLRQIGDSIRQARGTGELRVAAEDIRQWSQSLVAQGVSAGFVTRLISRLNDQLSCRLIDLVATRRAIVLEHVCWLAMGSEGREEQTIATDQDNGLIIDDDCTLDRQALLDFAREVNEGLDACGYPLCKGGIMAGNPKWCLPLSQWQALFDGWIDRGDPQSLLNANIFFDFRPLAGDSSLAGALRERITRRAAATPRFLKQMSDNALRNGPPVSWTGGLLETLFTREETRIDLKLNGTAPFVDGARVLALAGGVRETGTAERLQALAAAGRLLPDEVRGWVDAFQFLQGLRLRVQHRLAQGSTDDPNTLDVRELSEIDRRILKDAFRQARKLQQRMALDYPG